MRFTWKMEMMERVDLDEWVYLLLLLWLSSSSSLLFFCKS